MEWKNGLEIERQEKNMDGSVQGLELEDIWYIDGNARHLERQASVITADRSIVGVPIRGRDNILSREVTKEWKMMETQAGVRPGPDLSNSKNHGPISRVQGRLAVNSYNHLDESFYKELSEEERARAELGLYDFDHPSAFDFDKLADTISRLEQGCTMSLSSCSPHFFNPSCDKNGVTVGPFLPKVIDCEFSSPDFEPGLLQVRAKNVYPFSDGMLCLEPADVIIVEGILTFYDERIREKFTMKLVDADADEPLEEFANRLNA
ncbi:hypothetical protein OSTOST_17378 [Ostertagia ostertagi]